VCDFQELYRYLIDDYLIERCRKSRRRDFVLVTDFVMRLRMGKKIRLCEFEADSLADGLNSLSNREVDLPRVRYGKRQTLATLMSREAFLLAMFLRTKQRGL
jgi:hypothetical protein